MLYCTERHCTVLFIVWYKGLGEFLHRFAVGSRPAAECRFVDPTVVHSAPVKLRFRSQVRRHHRHRH
jgi:predicted secreted protein